MIKGQTRITFNRIPEVKRASAREVDEAIHALALDGEAYVKRIISESPAAGRQYGDHIASVPGMPPRIDTGNLVNGIYTKRVRDAVYAIASGAEYGPMLEFGTRRGLERRPFMGPTADYIRRDGEKFLVRVLRGKIK